MTSRHTLSFLLIATAAGLLIWWFAIGHHFWTTTQTMVEVKTTDELFGTTVTTQKWVDDFSPGLLPFSNMSGGSHVSGIQNVIYSIIGFLGIGLLSFLFAGTGAWLWFIARKKARLSI
jgi:hypothetical protein